jgi:predicted amidohydrolase YtcJ
VRAPGAAAVDLSGAFVVPGLTDAHAHLLGLGEALETLDLRGKQKREILAMVSAAAARTPREEWIRGRAWDQNLWPGRAFPTAAELSAVAPNNPVVLSRVDGHALWVNDVAMARAGITAATEDPDGGKIVRGGRSHRHLHRQRQALIGRRFHRDLGQSRCLLRPG